MSEEVYWNVIAGNSGPLPDVPLTREEMYLNKIATGDGAVPDTPLTRKEMYLAEIAANGGGGSATLLNNKDISSNGTYKASDDDADGYKKVTVSVANSYAAGDEGKVVSSGALVAQTAHAQVTQNGVVDTTTNNSVEVAVPQPSGTKQISITQNGTTTENVSGYASAEISVSVSGGGGVLLADITTDDNSNVLQVNFDSAMNGYMYYVVKLEFTKTGGSNMYPCPQINSLTSNAYGDDFSGSSEHSWNFTIAKSVVNGEKNHSMSVLLNSGGSNPTPKISGTDISYIGIKSYYDTVYFTAGTKIKVYGYLPSSEVT